LVEGCEGFGGVHGHCCGGLGGVSVGIELGYNYGLPLWNLYSWTARMATYRERKPRGLRDIVRCCGLLDRPVDVGNIWRRGHGMWPCSRGIDQCLEAGGEFGHGLFWEVVNKKVLKIQDSSSRSQFEATGKCRVPRSGMHFWMPIPGAQITRAIR
jgi:hypothetical protein